MNRVESMHATISTQAEVTEASRTIAAMRTYFTVRLASRAIMRFYDAMLAPSGLRTSHFAVLVGVFRGFGTTLTALGGVLGMDRTSLSKNLRPLLRRGFVMRVPTTDRRCRTLQTTRRGERLLAQTIPYWQRAQRHAVRTVGSHKWSTLDRELRGLVKAIGVREHHQAIGPRYTQAEGSGVGTLQTCSRRLID
jgi:DNA-binding MarR family transcriptional regulator